MRGRRTAVAGLVAVGALLAGLAAGYGVRGLDDPNTGCRVLDVIDGDTVRVRRCGVAEVVRLLCVDAPEKGQAGFEAAKAQVEQLLAAGAVDLQGEREDGLLKRDVYGRLLAYVWADGVLVNVELVRAGHSPYYVKYGKGRHPGAFLNAAADAR